MANRSTLLKFETRFFFQPGQLGTQTPDLGIQFVEFLLMFSFPGTCALAILFEQLDEILQCQLFPFMDLVRMNMVLRSDLSDTLVFAQCFQDDLSLEASRYAFSFGHVLSPESTPQLCPFLCLNFHPANRYFPQLFGYSCFSRRNCFRWLDSTLNQTRLSD